MNHKPLFIMSVLIFTILMYFNCNGGIKKNETSSNTQENEEGVTVTAEVEDEDSVEFVQAGESVQIGGTNLTQTTRKLTIHAIDIDSSGVKEVEVHSEDLVGNTFEVSKLPIGKFMRITLDDEKGAIIPPIVAVGGVNSFNIKVLVDGEMTIALKLFDLILDKAKNGDESAAQIVREKTLNVIDLVSTGGAIWEAQKDSTDKVELSTVAADLISSTKSLIAFLPEISSETFAQIISQANQDTIFSSIKTGTPSSSILSQIGVLIFQKKLEEESGGKQTSDLSPGFTAVKKLAAQTNTVLAAYAASQELAVKQVKSYAETGEISSDTDAAITSKKLENVQKYTENPASIEAAKPYEISSEDYQQYVDATIANQSSTPTSDPTPTTSTSPSMSSTPTPTSSSTTSTTPTTTTEPTTTTSPTTTTTPSSSISPDPNEVLEP